MQFEFKIAGLPVSTNDIWRSARRGSGVKVHKSEAYQAYLLTVKSAIRASGYAHNLFDAALGRPFKMRIELHRPSWIARNGNLKRPDLTNCIKSCEDAICSALGWDDVFNFHTEVMKVDKALSEFHVVKFWFYDTYCAPDQ